MRVYCREGFPGERVIEAIADVPGLEQVLSREVVAQEFDLPVGPEGDVAVLGDARTVIGAREADHDLSGLKGHRLRTHAASTRPTCRSSSATRSVTSTRARAEDARLHSYEAFDYAFNGIVD